jgi:hypothetical protein
MDRERKGFGNRSEETLGAQGLAGRLEGGVDGEKAGREVEGRGREGRRASAARVGGGREKGREGGRGRQGGSERERELGRGGKQKGL